MKYTSTLLAAFLTVAFVACSRVEPEVNPVINGETTSAGDVNVKQLDADAVEYYKDIAVLAEWYAKHPSMLTAAINNNKTHTYQDADYNTFIGELAELDLRDENNKRYSFFDLSASERHEFLRDYVKLQAKILDDKFNIAGTDAADDHIELINGLFDQVANTPPFSDAFNFEAEAAKITVANPFEAIDDRITHVQSPVIPAPASGNIPVGVNENDFWRDVAQLGFLSASPVNFNPLCFSNTPQKFVDNLRSNIAKGLVLVSLPAGTVTKYPLVFNGIKYDVGHVAIISKEKGDLPTSVNNTFTFTIGTNADKGMHHEEIQDGWTEKHGMTYLMKPVRTQYRKKWGIPIPWDKYTEDLNNNATYQKITEVIGKPYCSLPEIAYAKWKTPNKFICSSSAWWAIKEAHDIGIGDFYKSTIFPAGVFESSDMRVVAKTW